MGHIKWQWLAMVSLLLAFTAAAPAISDQPQDAISSTTTEDESAAATADDAADASADVNTAEECPDGSCPLVAECETCSAQDEACQLELPPLELELTTPPASTAGEATEIIALGVTAANQPPAENQAESAATTGGPVAVDDEGLAVPPLWTPNSGRFLLSERQEELSLAAEAEAEDRGDAPLHRPATTTKPASSPQKTTKPPAKPTAQPAVASPPLPPPQGAAAATSEQLPADQPALQAEPDGETAGLLETLELPDAEAGPTMGPRLIPSEQFSSRELANTETGTTLNAENAEPSEQQPEEASLRHIGVIPTQQIKAGHEPTLGEVLKGEAPDSALGSQVPGISPWRSIAVVLVCLALLFIGIAASKKLRGPFKLGKRSLQVIENISLGTGRQITIVEMGECALVLGVTPQSINLLDKVPLGLMNRAYQGTINAIISRESEALPDDWAQRPLFTVTEEPVAPRLAPSLGAETYGPSGRRVSVGELRRSRATRHFDEAGLLKPPGGRLAADSDTKSELISRIREQLNRLED